MSHWAIHALRYSRGERRRLCTGAPPSGEEHHAIHVQKVDKYIEANFL